MTTLFDPTAHPNRYDLSVNEARVEGAQSSTPIIVTGTTLNTAGAYTGGGTGNKAILGFKGHSGLALGAITSISWEWENVAPMEPGTLHLHPYMNLVLQMDPSPNAPLVPAYKILAIDPTYQALFPAMNMGTLTSLGPNKWRFDHVPGVNFVQVVNAFSTQAPAGIVPAMPLVCDPATGLLPVPIAGGSGAFLPPPPPAIVPTTWPSYTFSYPGILAAFPAAQLIDIYTGDGGLPGPSGVATPTPSMMLVVGDSSFRRQRYIKVTSVKINGAPA